MLIPNSTPERIQADTRRMSKYSATALGSPNRPIRETTSSEAHEMTTDVTPEISTSRTTGCRVVLRSISGWSSMIDRVVIDMCCLVRRLGNNPKHVPEEGTLGSDSDSESARLLPRRTSG